MEKNPKMNTPKPNYRGFHGNWTIFIFAWFAVNYLSGSYEHKNEMDTPFFYSRAKVKVRQNKKENFIL